MRKEVYERKKAIKSRIIDNLKEDKARLIEDKKRKDDLAKLQENIDKEKAEIRSLKEPSFFRKIIKRVQER